MRTAIVAAAVAAAALALPGTASAAVQQEGLVNVALEDVTIQVPIGVAANVCDLNVAVLAELGPDEAAPCDATVEQFPRPFRTPVG